MNVHETNQYVKNHGALTTNYQVELYEPLLAFKKVHTDTRHGPIREALANLIIPKGALVNLAQSSSGKLRSDMAICHSIVRIRDEQQLDTAVSMFDSYFTYTAVNGKIPLKELLGIRYYYNRKYSKFIVEPRTTFDTNLYECTSGIHFFIELDLALAYF